MKLIQLEYFVAICQNNFNISRTAEILHVSQPAISNAIKDLENEFGVNLFNRTNKHLELTREGQICLVSSKKILNDTALLADQMYNITHKNETIRIGISSMTGSKYIAEIISTFYKQHPYIHYKIENRGSIELLNSVEKDLCDLAIINIHKNVNFSARNIKVIPLYDTELLFCTNKNNPLAKNKYIDYSMIENEPIIVRNNNNDIDDKDIIAKKFLARGVTPNIPFSLEQLDAVKNFIRHGTVSSFLFEDMLYNETEIVGISMKEKEFTTVGIVYKNNHFLSDGENKFIELAKKICNNNLNLL